MSANHIRDLQDIVENLARRVKDLEGVHSTTPTSSVPSGPAGGDLSGLYPNPSVAKVNGVGVTGTPTPGQVPTATSGSAATWQTPTGTPGSSAPGDIAATGTAVTFAASDHLHGRESAAYVTAGGLTGAANAARMVGGNASGAPTTGTFNTRDVVVNTDGTEFVCTAAGTPGTWVQVGGAPVMTKIGSVVLGSSQTTMTINVSGSFSVLQGFYTAATNGSALSDVLCTFNGDTGSNYDWVLTQGTNTGTFAAGNNNTTSIRLGTTSRGSNPTHHTGAGQFSVPQPNGAQFKTMTGTGMGPDSFGAQHYLETYGGQWRSTAAITSVTLGLTTADSFIAGSSFTLYGLT